jgi:hypothetical protein
LECRSPSEPASAALSDFCPNGFAVKFVEKQNRNDLNRLIARPALVLPSASRVKAAPSSSNSGGDVAA